jgi:hypothetical protein
LSKGKLSVKVFDIKITRGFQKCRVPASTRLETLAVSTAETAHCREISATLRPANFGCLPGIPAFAAHDLDGLDPLIRSTMPPFDHLCRARRGARREFAWPARLLCDQTVFSILGPSVSHLYWPPMPLLP